MARCSQARSLWTNTSDVTQAVSLRRERGGPPGHSYASLMTTNSSPNFISRRAAWIILPLIALVGLAIVLTPVWIIQPFKPQSVRGLEMSEWDFTGKAVSGALNGKQLKKVSVLNDYWFDWKTNNPKTTIYQLGNR